MKRSYLLLVCALLSGCTGYTEPYIASRPYVTGPLPYSGPSKVTVIDHGPVFVSPSIRSTSSYSYQQRTDRPYYGERPNYYNSYPYQSYNYSPYSHHNYCAPHNYVTPRVERGHDRSYFSGSDYGYSSYRNATRSSTYRRY